MRLPNEEFKVLLYGPDLPASGVRGRAHFENGLLILHGSGHWYTATMDKLGLKTGGYDGRQWLLTWDSPVGQFTALLQGDSAVDSFIKRAPDDLAERLHLVRNKAANARYRFRIGLAALGLVTLLPVFALVWFWLNADRFSVWAAEQVSLQQEAVLGDMAMAQLKGRVKLLPDDGLADEMVERIGLRLTGGSAHTFRFYVADDAAVNAYALPGGHVVVNTGLLQAATCADEVAGVLAHEASHVELRHVLRNIIHSLGIRAVLAVVMGDMGAGVWGNMAGEGAANLINMAYSRDLEREADLHGLRILRRAGVPAEGMARFFEKMAQQESADSGSPVAILSTHPASAERLQALRKAIADQGDYIQRPLVLDWMALKESL